MASLTANETALLEAVGRGRLEEVRHLLNKGANVNVKDCGDRDLSGRVAGWTPLHYAIVYNLNTNIAAELIKYGADVEARDDNGYTPISNASWLGSNDMILLLLQHNADVNARSDTGETALMRASSGGPRHGLNEEDDFAQTIRILIQNGASLNARDNSGRTALHYGCRSHNELAQELLKHAGVAVDARDNNGETPLHRVCCLPAITRALLERGADINALDLSGETPLYKAVKIGAFSNLDFVEELIERGAVVDAPDKDGLTPLHLASAKGMEKIVRVLVHANANVDARDVKDNSTPLHYASLRIRSAKALRVLLEFGADANARDRLGRTPLHLASRKGSQDAVEALIEHNAVVDARESRNGSTPLHFASAAHETETVRKLLNHGADGNAQTKDGSTPLHLASAKGPFHFGVVRMLLDHGVHLDLKNKKGETAWSLAQKKKNELVLEVLRKHVTNRFELVQSIAEDGGSLLGNLRCSFNLSGKKRPREE